MEDIMQLCDVVRETGFAIHRYHKHGHLEKVYENALVHRLRKLGLDVKQQHPIRVYDEDGTPIGDYNADLFVDNRLIIEPRAAKAPARIFHTRSQPFINTGALARCPDAPLAGQLFQQFVPLAWKPLKRLESPAMRATPG